MYQGGRDNDPVRRVRMYLPQKGRFQEYLIGNLLSGKPQEDVRANLDEEVGVFTLPGIDPEYGTPVLGNGDQFVVFNDTPEVRQFMEFLTTWESARNWAAAGGALFPHQDQDFEDYGNPIDQYLAKTLVNAEVFRFDASDLMPAEVIVGLSTGLKDRT